MEEKPMVSLVMKVYNGEKYLREAVDSILSQTYQDFELIIIDDGSSDNSAEIVHSYVDKRIRFLQNEKNLGLCETQNRVIAAAEGKYIAVMDCDDISYPTRFEKQVAYLEQHPEVMMCGTFRNDIIEGNEIPFQEPEWLSDSTLRFSLVFGNFFFTHSSIMFRAKEYRENGLQYGPAKIAEDYQVIIEMAKRYPVAILPERLIAYRIYPQSTSKVRLQEITDAGVAIKSDYLRSLPVSEKNKQLLLDYFRTDTAMAPLSGFLDAMQEVAGISGADITKNGNAYGIARELVIQYIVKSRKYDMILWKSLRQSAFRSIASLRNFFGWKLLGGCLFHYRRK